MREIKIGPLETKHATDAAGGFFYYVFMAYPEGERPFSMCVDKRLADLKPLDNPAQTPEDYAAAAAQKAWDRRLEELTRA